ncbi:MAG: hypothetical protein H9W81_04340 [Enterococcus sp.]|nr:hypothetical protein [Enterococcus sp.]
MAKSKSGRTLRADEVSERIRNARYHIDLGSGSLLGTATPNYTQEDMEKSLGRLIQKVSPNNAKRTYLR